MAAAAVAPLSRNAKTSPERCPGRTPNNPPRPNTSYTSSPAPRMPVKRSLGWEPTGGDKYLAAMPLGATQSSESNGRGCLGSGLALPEADAETAVADDSIRMSHQSSTESALLEVCNRQCKRAYSTASKRLAPSQTGNCTPRDAAEEPSNTDANNSSSVCRKRRCCRAKRCRSAAYFSTSASLAQSGKAAMSFLQVQDAMHFGTEYLGLGAALWAPQRRSSTCMPHSHAVFTLKRQVMSSHSDPGWQAASQKC
mmetsp:Transcript_23892/g.67672  ORF Transcript_23892/g.67672 Transcript_23892/m.67672 type:complete len:253 (+) Transcript_23892:463-1221(+)